MSKSFKNMNDDELNSVISNGHTAVGFKESPFGIIISECMKNETNIAKSDSEWNPSKAIDLNVIALTNAYNSGKIAGINIIKTVIQRFIIDKDEALKELKIREERKNK